MMLAVPEALAGGAFFMYLFPKIMQGWDAPPMDFSVAVWVGFIACFGMATETGIIMLVYLREAIAKRGGLENIASLGELRQAVIEGAVHRLRPKLLTEAVAIVAIFPLVFAPGVGAGPMLLLRESESHKLPALHPRGDAGQGRGCQAGGQSRERSYAHRYDALRQVRPQGRRHQEVHQCYRRERRRQRCHLPVRR